VQISPEARLPAAVTHRPRLAHQAARRGKDQCHRQLRRRGRPALGAADDNPQRRGRGNVGGGVPAPGRHDKPKVGQGGDDLGGQQCPLTHQAQSIEVPEPLDQCRARHCVAERGDFGVQAFPVRQPERHALIVVEDRDPH
jgi:hypothetical protein